MKSYKTYSDSAYLRKEDFPEPETLTIKEVREEEVQAPGKESKLKIVIYFEEYEKGVVLNQANGLVLELLTGYDDPEKWVGVRLRVYHDPTVEFGGKRVGGIRFAALRRKPVPPKSTRTKSIPRPVIPAPSKPLAAGNTDLVEAAAGKQAEEDTDEIPY
jgi:hypothetical protein